MRNLKMLSAYLLMLILTAGTVLGNPLGKEDTRTMSFKVNPGELLNVDVETGDIKINTGNENRVVVKLKGVEDEDLEDAEFVYEQGVVYVKFESHWGWSSDIEINISIPKNFNMEVETMGGDIKVVGDLKGYMELSTWGGDVSFGNVDGDADVSSQGGDISAGNVTGALEISTQGGDITVGNVAGKQTELNTMGGDIEVGNVASSLYIKTMGGDILVGDVGGSLDATTFGGDVDIKSVSGSAKAETYGGNIKLSGASGEIVAETKGGNIMLKNISGTVKAETMAGNIYAELNPARTGKSYMESMSGDVTLVIPGNAKAHIRALVNLMGYWGHDYFDIDVDVDDDGETRVTMKDKRKEKRNDGDKLKDKIKSDFKDSLFELDNSEVRAEYILNGGGHKIYLETSNGNISIKKK